MVENLEDYLLKKKLIIEESLNDYIEKINAPKQLKDSMHYSLMAGGKRLRPVLLMLSYEAYQTMNDKVISSAAALEMIHTYSLIHDDLPAMDDDDYRRGKPTNHKMFDEATAILAGDALLTYSFEIISEDPILSANNKVKLISMLAQKGGNKGMIVEQMLDIEAEKIPVQIKKLVDIHTSKTGQLVSLAITAGAYLGHSTPKQLAFLDEFSYNVCLIFQVQHDILDVTGDP